MSRFATIRNDSVAISNGFVEICEQGDLVNYAYCDHCGREFFEEKLEYVCTYASGPVYKCPGLDCEKEISIVEVDEQI